MKSVAIIGKPNSGKSLLFNRITGLSQKVANFPGVTVDVKSGSLGNLQILDLPGIYTFHAVSSDEDITVDIFSKNIESPDVVAVICVLDATKIQASLRLGLEVQMRAAKVGKPVLFVLNMVDIILENNLEINVDKLSRELGAPVVSVSAKTSMGIENLKELILSAEQITPVLYKNIDYVQRAKEISSGLELNVDLLFKTQNRLDKLLLSSRLGWLFFTLIMLVLFQAIFSWAAPFMDLVETVISKTGELAVSTMAAESLRDFVKDAIFAGLGSFLVFVPQIFFLTFIIGLLEDSGYLARAAVICHRPLKYFGLSGKSFVALLSGHACAIPAIYASRTIESPKSRFLTMLIIPLMGCSARLPVYTLLISAFIPPLTIWGGIFGLQGLTFFTMYLLGLVVGLFVAWVLSKVMNQKQSDTPFILELPPYRMPHWLPLIRRSFQSCVHFVTKAGFIIFTVTVGVWILGYFPGGSGELESSWLAGLGRLIEPLTESLGLDWKYGVAILSSFLAREVFVGTLGALMGIEDTESHAVGLIEKIQLSGLSMGSGFALLVFYAVAMQCVSTLAILRKELNSWRIPVFLFLGYGFIAYTLAWLVYRTLQ